MQMGRLLLLSLWSVTSSHGGSIKPGGETTLVLFSLCGFVLLLFLGGLILMTQNWVLPVMWIT